MTFTSVGILAKRFRRRLGVRSAHVRLCAAAVVFAWGLPTEAGSISPLSTLRSTSTLAPNNEDYAGAFADNSNKATFNSNAVPVASGTISNLEAIFAVVESNGTTEYAITIQGAYDSDVDPPLTAGYRLQVGFGIGASFVPASVVLPGLDFDFPQPANPRCRPRSAYLGLRPFSIFSRTDWTPSPGRDERSLEASFTRPYSECRWTYLIYRRP